MLGRIANFLFSVILTHYTNEMMIGGLPSMGSHRVTIDFAAAAAGIGNTALDLSEVQNQECSVHPKQHNNLYISDSQL